MKPLFYLTALLSLIITDAASQSNPSPVSLPYSQNFSALSHSSSVYPAGWQGWLIGTSSSTSFRTNAPTGDIALTASGTAASTSAGIYNYNSKLGILSSGSADVALCLAINTSGLNSVKVQISATSTLRNPFDGSANTRLNSMTLQYRVGTSGIFTTLGGFYTNNTVTQTGAVTTPQNTLNRTYVLPPDCNNQPNVQLRWVQRDNSGSGSRPGFAIDDISVCAPILTPGVTITQTGGSNPSAPCRTNAFTATPVNGGPVQQYIWKINNVTTQSSLSPNYSVDTLKNTDTVSCTMFSSEQCVLTTIAESNKIIMAVNPVTVVISADNNNAITCNGTIVVYTAIVQPSNANVVFQWKKNGFTNVGINSDIYIDSSLVTGNFTVSCELTVASLCGVSTATSNGIGHAVFDNAVAPDSISVSASSICQGESVVLKVHGGNPANGVFAWYAGGCVNFFNGGTGAFEGSGDSIVVTPNFSKSYFMSIEGICPVSYCDSLPVTVHSYVTPSVSITSDYNPVTVCGGTPITYTATSTGGGSNPLYEWIKNGNVASPVGTGEVYIDSSLVVGSYSITCRLTSNAPCISGQNPVFSNGMGKLVLATPVAPTVILASDTAVCAGDTVILKRIGGDAGSGVFAWTQDGCGNIFTGGTGSFITAGDSIIITPSTTHTYYLYIDGLCPDYNCRSVTIHVGTPSTPPDTIIVSHSDTTGILVPDFVQVCGGSTVTLTAQGGTLGSGSQWVWYNVNDLINPIATGASFNFTVPSNVTSTAFKVRAEGFCNTTSFKSITLLNVVPSTLPTLLALPSLICEGQSVTLNANSGGIGSAGYCEWRKDSCNGPIIAINRSQSLVVSPTVTTTYFLRIYDLCDTLPCVSTTVTVRSLSQAADSVSVSSTGYCDGTQSLTLTLNGGSLGTGASWFWRMDNCSATTLGTGSSITINPVAGIHTFHVTAIGTCNTTPCVISVPVNIQPLLNWFRDFDGDGFGTNSNVIIDCTQPPGYVATGNDCNDNNSAINLSATEICGNGIDENCNGNADDTCSSGALLNLKVFFEGYYIGNGTMFAAIDPLNSPNICDSISVELHDAFPPYATAFAVTGVVSVTGNGQFTFPVSAIGNSYYIAVKHKNSVEAWSKNPVTFSAVTSFDFTSP